SLVNTAKLNSVDPEVWLADVLERIISGKVPANRMDTLFPWAW
ncbi:transposase domain-containing protein, partial [Sinorhizobium meliloti]